jgi:hypothetical protein
MKLNFVVLIYLKLYRLVMADKKQTENSKPNDDEKKNGREKYKINCGSTSNTENEKNGGGAAGSRGDCPRPGGDSGGKNPDKKRKNPGKKRFCISILY